MYRTDGFVPTLLSSANARSSLNLLLTAEFGSAVFPNVMAPAAQLC
jgi:hypothetical protein